MGIKADEHVLVIDDVYGGTQRYFRKIVSQVQHTDFTFADFTNPEVFKSSFKENTKVIMDLIVASVDGISNQPYPQNN